MSKTKARRKSKSSTRASRHSHRLNPAPDDPNTCSPSNSLAQSTPTPSSGNLLNAQTIPAVPRYQFTPIIGANLRNMAPIPTLSSLDTLTPSPVPVAGSNNENPFVRNSPAMGAPVGPGQIPDWRIRQDQALSMNCPSSAPVGAMNDPLIIRHSIGHMNNVPRNVNPGPAVTIIDNDNKFLTESQRARRCTEKVRHHGAFELDEDNVANDIDIQQAILNNTPPIIDPRPKQIPTMRPTVKPSESQETTAYLPHPASAELNALFNQAVNILTSSMNLTNSNDPGMDDSIAQIAGNHFTANLEAAVQNLMLPRTQTETNEQYLKRLQAQQRFYEGINPVPTVAVKQSVARTVHFPDSTPNITRIDSVTDRRARSEPHGRRNEPSNANQRAQTEPLPCETAFTDHVAVQRMRNGEMRETGHSNFPDQGISFDHGGNPYD
ncbi:hypothetical protein C8J56DRAFT_885289 [Mycena floridula]|nr:hypothetical protein C8J56DRAFT_885289 [Mycena floridula]